MGWTLSSKSGRTFQPGIFSTGQPHSKGFIPENAHDLSVHPLLMKGRAHSKWPVAEGAVCYSQELPSLLSSFKGIMNFPPWSLIPKPEILLQRWGKGTGEGKDVSTASRGSLLKSPCSSKGFGAHPDSAERTRHWGTAGKPRQSREYRNTHLINYIIQQFKDGHGRPAVHPMACMVKMTKTVVRGCSGTAKGLVSCEKHVCWGTFAGRGRGNPPGN